MEITNTPIVFSLRKGLNMEGQAYYSKAEIQFSKTLNCYRVSTECHDNDFLDEMGVQSIGQIREASPERIESALLKTGYTKKLDIPR